MFKQGSKDSQTDSASGVISVAPKIEYSQLDRQMWGECNKKLDKQNGELPEWIQETQMVSEKQETWKERTRFGETCSRSAI